MCLSGICPSDKIHKAQIETNLSDIGLHGIVIIDL
jgi:hypothetical protein